MGGFGPTEVIIIAIVLVVLFIGSRGNYFARGIGTLTEEWKAQYSRRFFVTGLLGGISLIVIRELESAGTISSEQALALFAVMVGWLLVGYYCIGKGSKE